MHAYTDWRFDDLTESCFLPQRAFGVTPCIESMQSNFASLFCQLAHPIPDFSDIIFCRPTRRCRSTIPCARLVPEGNEKVGGIQPPFDFAVTIELDPEIFAYAQIDKGHGCQRFPVFNASLPRAASLG